MTYSLLVEHTYTGQKRFYTRGTLRSIRITRLTKISILYRAICWSITKYIFTGYNNPKTGHKQEFTILVLGHITLKNLTTHTLDLGTLR